MLARSCSLPQQRLYLRLRSRRRITSTNIGTLIPRSARPLRGKERVEDDHSEDESRASGSTSVPIPTPPPIHDHPNHGWSLVCRRGRRARDCDTDVPEGAVNRSGGAQPLRLCAFVGEMSLFHRLERGRSVTTPTRSFALSGELKFNGALCRAGHVHRHRDEGDRTTAPARASAECHGEESVFTESSKAPQRPSSNTQIPPWPRVADRVADALRRSNQQPFAESPFPPASQSAQRSPAQPQRSCSNDTVAMMAPPPQRGVNRQQSTHCSSSQRRRPACRSRSASLAVTAAVARHLSVANLSTAASAAASVGSTRLAPCVAFSLPLEPQLEESQPPSQQPKPQPPSVGLADHPRHCGTRHSGRSSPRSHPRVRPPFSLEVRAARRAAGARDSIEQGGPTAGAVTAVKAPDASASGAQAFVEASCAGRSRSPITQSSERSDAATQPARQTRLRCQKLGRFLNSEFDAADDSAQEAKLKERRHQQQW